MGAFLAFLARSYGLPRISARVGIRVSSLRRLRAGVRPPLKRELNALRRLRREIGNNRMSRAGVPSAIRRRFRDSAFARQNSVIGTFDEITRSIIRDNIQDKIDAGEVTLQDAEASVRRALRMSDQGLEDLRDKYT